MNKQKFVEQLRITAEVFKPLTRDKFEILYLDKDVPGKINDLVPDPYALVRWGELNAIASLIEVQEGPLSKKQITFLKKSLIGGMGSLLLDCWFDPRKYGQIGTEINEKLKEESHKLYLIFKELEMDLEKE